MQDIFYMARRTVLINFTREYVKTPSELLNSFGFSEFLDGCLEKLHQDYPEVYVYFRGTSAPEEFKAEIIKFLKLLNALEFDDIEHRFTDRRDYVTTAIELGYEYWRNLQRISFMYTRNADGFQFNSFISADDDFNAMILSFYRNIQERAQGYANSVYRQLQAGTNASMVITAYTWSVPGEYARLAGVPFVNKMMLRTPLILRPLSNKRENVFVASEINPIRQLHGTESSWVCYPAKVGDQLMFCYFHKDYVKSMIAMPNLFEMASEKECTNRKPDCIMIFGNQDNTEDTVYYHDSKNGIWVGKVSDHDKAEYFGYVKKMMLTLHNLAVMEKGWLPIHGAMINFYLKDGSKRGIVLMGDSGAGKSETIEALTKIAEDEIIRQEIVFDDMGSFHIDDNGEVVAQGTEIGAFVRLDDLDSGTAYRDIDRAVFFNPEVANARVVTPAAPYGVVAEPHRVDMFLYANNYTDATGVEIIDSLESARKIFVEGKRFALGTTQETGLSTTYFANPFGPMQEAEKCDPIIDEMLGKLFKNGVPVGEVYTNLGVKNGSDAILHSAEELLRKVKEL